MESALVSRVAGFLWITMQLIHQIGDSWHDDLGL